MGPHHLRRVKRLTAAEVKLIDGAQRDATAEKKADELIRQRARAVRRALHG